jgi:DNA-binding beta-propeller fold protein YncE
MRPTLAVLLFCLSAQAADYKLLHSIPVPGDAGWDYILADAASRKLFVSHGSHVQVIDLDSEKIVGDIPDTPGVHGIAIAEREGKGFITAGKAARVDIFDLATLAKTGSIPAGANPDAITYDPDSNRVLAFNGHSKDVTVIDAHENSAQGLIRLNGKPEAGVADGHGHVFVNLEDLNEIAELDPRALKVVRHFKIAGCDSPSGLAIDQKNRRLYAGCENKVMAVVDSHSARTLAVVPIGEGVDACDFDPATGYAFASTGDGHLTIIRETSPGKFAVVQTVNTQPSARTMSLDKKTHRAYLPAAQMGTPPAPSAANPHPRPPMIVGSFVVLVVGP